jgi:5,5'-dehydrodivanillate O-demethylase
LRQFWTPVAMLDDVKPGRARPIQIMSEWFTYYRGESGTPHVIAFACPHRNTRLATGWVEGECIRCFYHGWKFDAGGQCVEQPAEDESFAQKIKIAGYPTREQFGLVFAYLGSGDPPAFPNFDGFEGSGTLETASYVRKSNYYNQRENSSDVVHVHFVHRRSDFSRSGFNRDIPTLDAVETEYGIRGEATFADGKVNVHHILMPLGVYEPVFSQEAGWIDHLAWRVPVDDESHRSFIVDRIHKSGPELEAYRAKRSKRARARGDAQPVDEIVNAILRGDMHIDDVPADHPDIVNIQDSVSLNVQPLISERVDRLGRSDNEVILLRRIMAREIAALGAGKPIKKWRWEEMLSIDSGT